MEFLSRLLGIAFTGLILYEKYLDWRDERSDKCNLRETLADERNHNQNIISTTTSLFESYSGLVEEYMALSATTTTLNNAARVQFLENELGKAESLLMSARGIASETVKENLGFVNYIRSINGPPEQEEANEIPEITMMRNEDGSVTLIYPEGFDFDQYVPDLDLDFDAHEVLESDDDDEEDEEIA